MYKILCHIDDELELINNRVNKELIINKAGTVSSYAHLEFSHLDSIIRPAVVVLSAKVFDYKKEPTITFASIIQLIYMGTKAHAHITEMDTQPGIDLDPRDGCQYPVLVGDYLYGKTFRLLVDTGLVRYLGPLAEMICHISEGCTLQCQLANANVTAASDYALEIVRKETAELFGRCSSIAADINGAAKEQIEQMYDFGVNFGCGYGLLQRGNASQEEINIYFNRALETLKSLAPSDGQQQLTELTELLKQEEIILRRMVG
ncbi:polyprenyl synthetase family protein [Desulfofalx alkaliphila]|uniref:polyprenyl synthetase family protein n=1 Tax=Desulfofalx alkaliphila TaxID=105483 RepID=UPI00068A3015|nr:polyprenyl synthetase family protein [Desulfofalx alkaliphila]